ncbi:MAG: ribosome biogenesis GTPase Der, partial [Lentisphaeria bacterium]|nr:ribosome biogenesis GTPase Der [Lentisphaeria bacterium]
HLPTIAIVGRPNVGKSSLFNAIIGRRLSIVHEMSGVTRYRLAAPAQRDGRRFMLVDTGGLSMLEGETRQVDFWDTGIARQVECAIADADVLIMVGDAQTGVTPLDRDIAVRLRATGKPVLAAANKCDNPKLKDDAAEFSELGFGNVFPISCEHRGGITALLDRALSLLPEERSAEAEAVAGTPVRIAVIGRPNVGKSSLINALIGENRVMTSDVAGTTRDAVDIDFSITYRGEARPAVLVDTAGMRKRAKVDSVVELFSVMRAKSAIERSDLVLFVVEAGDGGVTAQYRRIAAMIRDAAKGCVIVANKVDRCPGSSVKALTQELRYNLPGIDYAPVEFVSALEHRRLETLLDRIAEVMENLETELPTGVLNRVIRQTIECNPPPPVGTARLKIFYAAMVGVKPARVRLFVNRPELAPDGFLAFLQKQLRAAFELSGAPLILELNARPKKVESIRRKEFIPARRPRKTARPHREGRRKNGKRS